MDALSGIGSAFPLPGGGFPAGPTGFPRPGAAPDVAGPATVRPGEMGGPVLTPGGSGEGFGNVLGRFIDGVNETQRNAELQTRRVLLGETDNLHQAMLAGEESKVALTLLVEVRNKLVEGFQEVMRMQV